MSDQEYQINVDVASDWSWSLLVNFLCSVGDKLSLVRYVEVELAIKTQHLTLMQNILVFQCFFFLIHCKSLYFPSLF